MYCNKTRGGATPDRTETQGETYCVRIAHLGQSPDDMRALRWMLLAVMVASCEASDEEAKAKAVRMKTTRQLRQIFDELGIDAPASLSKDEMRELALQEDAISRWEELHPEKKRRPRAAGGGGMDFGDMKTPEGMDPLQWAKLKAQMSGDFSHEADPEKRRILEKLKASGISFGGASDMDIEQCAPQHRTPSAAAGCDVQSPAVSCMPCHPSTTMWEH